MKNFDIRRAVHLLWCQLNDSRAEMFKVYGGMTVAFVLIFILIAEFANGFDKPDDVYVELARVNIALAILVLMVAATYFTTTLFSDMRDKRVGTRFLMLPASNLEKFVVRIVYVSVMLPLLVMAAIVSADIIRLLVSQVWGRPLVLGLAGLFEFNNDNVFLNGSEGLIAACYLGGGILSHSVSVLGGTFFRKHSFLLTYLVQFLVTMVLAHVFLLLKGPDLIEMLNLITVDGHDNLMLSPYMWVLVPVQLLLSAAFYCVAFRLFCRMQVINNKWVNL